MLDPVVTTLWMNGKEIDLVTDVPMDPKTFMNIPQALANPNPIILWIHVQVQQWKDVA